MKHIHSHRPHVAASLTESERRLVAMAPQPERGRGPEQYQNNESMDLNRSAEKHVKLYEDALRTMKKQFEEKTKTELSIPSNAEETLNKFRAITERVNEGLRVNADEYERLCLGMEAAIAGVETQMKSRGIEVKPYVDTRREFWASRFENDQTVSAVTSDGENYFLDLPDNWTLKGIKTSGVSRISQGRSRIGFSKNDVPENLTIVITGKDGNTYEVSATNVPMDDGEIRFEWKKPAQEKADAKKEKTRKPRKAKKAEPAEYDGLDANFDSSVGLEAATQPEQPRSIPDPLKEAIDADFAKIKAEVDAKDVEKKIVERNNLLIDKASKAIVALMDHLRTNGMDSDATVPLLDIANNALMEMKKASVKIPEQWIFQSGAEPYIIRFDNEGKLRLERKKTEPTPAPFAEVFLEDKEELEQRSILEQGAPETPATERPLIRNEKVVPVDATQTIDKQSARTRVNRQTATQKVETQTATQKIETQSTSESRRAALDRMAQKVTRLETENLTPREKLLLARELMEDFKEMVDLSGVQLSERVKKADLKDLLYEAKNTTKDPMKSLVIEGQAFILNKMQEKLRNPALDAEEREEWLSLNASFEELMKLANVKEGVIQNDVDEAVPVPPAAPNFGENISPDLLKRLQESGIDFPGLPSKGTDAAESSRSQRRKPRENASGTSKEFPEAMKKDMEAKANEALKGFTLDGKPERDINLKKAKVMLTYGVDVEEKGNELIARAPANGTEKFINQLIGLVLLITSLTDKSKEKRGEKKEQIDENKKRGDEILKKEGATLDEKTGIYELKADFGNDMNGLKFKYENGTWMGTDAAKDAYVPLDKLKLPEESQSYYLTPEQVELGKKWRDLFKRIDGKPVTPATKNKPPEDAKASASDIA